MSRRPTPLAALLVALALAVGGCSSGTDKATEKSIEKAAEDNGKDVDVDVDGDEIKVETSDGTLTAGTGELPKGYPKDEVPVLDGEVAVGMEADGGWSVTIKSDKSPEDALAEAVSKLESAGLSKEEGGGMLGPNSATLTGNGYGVLLSVTDLDGAAAVVYFVSHE